MYTTRILVIVCLCGLLGCKTSSVTKKTTPGEYAEDLSYLRPDLSTEVTTDTAQVSQEIGVSTAYAGNIKSELDSVNQIIIAKNEEQPYIDGFTIQIYTGNDRQAANEARSTALMIDPSLNPVISYHQPGYKVKVGQYTDRLKAHKVFTSLKEQFPLALLIPERIKLTYD